MYLFNFLGYHDMTEQIEYYGPMAIDAIVNPLSDKEKEIFYSPLTEDEVKFIHYSNCQQLQLWLPELKTRYHSFILLYGKNWEGEYHAPISQVISGAVKLTFETLCIPPGPFLIQITSSFGLVHEVQCTKFMEGYQLPLPQINEMEMEENKKEPIVYRDGFGNIINYGDTDWREIYY